MKSCPTRQSQINGALLVRQPTLLAIEETIAAIATAPGPALRGAVRVSGDDAPRICDRVFLAKNGAPTTPSKRATARSGQMLLSVPLGAVPCELFIWPTRISYTRQPIAEFHLVGSPPILQAALRQVCHAGARLAEPGEFTLRAFLSGRIDLTQAEAVLGVIDAKDRAQLSHALDQLAGGLSKPLGQLRNNLLNLCADLEAGLDFVDEDIEFISSEEVMRQLLDGAAMIQEVLDQIRGRGEVRESPRVVLRGAPNVGKSTLWNAITRQTPAIVSEIAGTTRDYLRAEVDIGGTSIELIDTAGVFEGAGVRSEIDQAAMSSSEKQSTDAHLVLFCLDATRHTTPWEQQQLTSAAADNWIVVLNKSDAVEPTASGGLVRTSGLTGLGIPKLLEAIRDRLGSSDHEYFAIAGTATRCQESLRLAGECLRRASQVVAESRGDELAVADIRSALDELGKVVGAVYTDDVLDRIFSRFCIGK